MKGKREKIVTLLETPAEPVKLTDRQGLALAAVRARGGNARVADLAEIDDPLPVLKALEKKGLVRLGETETLRAPGTPGMIGRADLPVRLNPEQEIALGQILKGISSGVFSPCLLHGVTGSGKTEVYIRAIIETLHRGGRAIYLVPEIALTPQLISRLSNRFPAGEIAVLHSGIGPAVRYDQWRKIQRGEAKIVVGARSAIFAPVENLRLIVVDEEHDSSYKQDERMPYNARDLAVVRAKQQGAAVVLGSATPGLQTFYNTREKEFVLPRPHEARRGPGVSSRRGRGHEKRAGRRRQGSTAVAPARRTDRPHTGSKETVPALPEPAGFQHVSLLRRLRPCLPVPQLRRLSDPSSQRGGAAMPLLRFFHQGPASVPGMRRETES